MNNLSKERNLAIEIIEEVEETILCNNTDIKTEHRKGNTLIYGEVWYKLEDYITEKIKENG